MRCRRKQSPGKTNKLISNTTLFVRLAIKTLKFERPEQQASEFIMAKG
jgi:hypothetical protein